MMKIYQDKTTLLPKQITTFDGSDITASKSFMLNFERAIDR